MRKPEWDDEKRAKLYIVLKYGLLAASVAFLLLSLLTLLRHLIGF
jgi:hypothetical protein